MTGTVPLELVTTGLIGMLAAVEVSPGVQMRVGDVDAPTPTVLPYTVVERVPGGGSLQAGVNDPDAVVEAVYQVTCVGRTRRQCEGLADRAHTAILSRSSTGFSNTITAAGAVIIQRAHGTAGGTTADGPVFNTVNRYVLTVAAAPT